MSRNVTRPLTALLYTYVLLQAMPDLPPSVLDTREKVRSEALERRVCQCGRGRSITTAGQETSTALFL